MNRGIRRRDVLGAGLAFTAALVAPPLRACEFFASTLRIVHPWTCVTLADAAFAMVCMKFDEVTTADRLIGVETPVAARAELAGGSAGPALDLAIPEGAETVLSETGTHVRLLGLTQPLLIARVYPLKLVFEKGGAVNAALTVDVMRFFSPKVVQSKHTVEGVAG